MLSQVQKIHASSESHRKVETDRPVTVSRRCGQRFAGFFLIFLFSIIFPFINAHAIDWRIVNPAVTGTPWDAVAYGNGVFIAVNREGEIHTSSDGINWSEQNSGTTTRLTDVIWDGSRFIAVGFIPAVVGGKVLTSPDGITWSEQTIPHNNTLPWEINWNGSQYLIVGPHYFVLTSPDATTWTKQDIGPVLSLRGVVWTGSQYVAVGMGGGIVTSPDGVDWTSQESGTTALLNKVAWNGSEFVAVSFGGSVVTSPDGITWTDQFLYSFTARRRLNDIVWDGTKFVVVGEGGFTMTSPDGVTWTKGSSETASDLASLAWDGSQFVAVGAGFRGNGLSFISSTDGIDWTEWNLGIGETMRDSAWDGSQYVMVATSSLNPDKRRSIFTSPDGMSWSKYELESPDLANDQISLNAVTFGDGKYVLGSGFLTMFSSPDGFNWTSHFAQLTGASSVNWSGGLFIATGSGGGIHTSPDGENWTKQSSGTTNFLGHATWGGDKFVAVGSAGTIVSSADGAIWTVENSGVTENLHGIAWDGTRFVVVGTAGTVLTSTDGQSWASQDLGMAEPISLIDVAWGDGQFVAIGQFQFFTSPDGINWTVQPSGQEEFLFTIEFQGNGFVAGGNNGIIILSGLPNQPPIANAGFDQSALADEFNEASFTLDASGSLDMDIGDSLTYSWSGPFGTADGSSPTVTIPVGTHIVTLTVTDSGGLTDTSFVFLSVIGDPEPPPADSTPPAIGPVSDIIAEAISPAGVVVSYAIPTATDDTDPSPTVSCSPISGSTFALGPTMVTCNAFDAAGNSAVPATFMITVVDTTPPVMTVPGDITVTATGPAGTVVTYSASATDLVDGSITPSCSAASGSTFPVGTNTVTCSATDAHGNTASASFAVKVQYAAFGGFLSPLKDGGVYKLGRTLPVKFQMFFADGSPATTGTATLQLQMLSGSEPTGDPIDAVSTSAADSGNTFRLSDSMYIFNLSTDNLSAGMYRLSVDLGDDSTPRMIDIGFK